MKTETTWSSSLIDSISTFKYYIDYLTNSKENIFYFIVKLDKDFNKFSGYCIRVIYNKLTVGNGSIIASDNLSPELVTKLLDNNIISPEISDEEFRIQRALGTIEIRKYKIDELKLEGLNK